MVWILSKCFDFVHSKNLMPGASGSDLEGDDIEILSIIFDTIQIREIILFHFICKARYHGRLEAAGHEDIFLDVIFSFPIPMKCLVFLFLLCFVSDG